MKNTKKTNEQRISDLESKCKDACKYKNNAPIVIGILTGFILAGFILRALSNS